MNLFKSLLLLLTEIPATNLASSLSDVSGWRRIEPLTISFVGMEFPVFFPFCMHEVSKHKVKNSMGRIVLSTLFLYRLIFISVRFQSFTMNSGQIYKKKIYLCMKLMIL